MQLREARSVILLLVFSTLALAQKNEASLSVGAVVTSDQQTTLQFVCSGAILTCPTPFTIRTSTSTGAGYEGSYTRQLFNFRTASLGVELPLVGVPGRHVTSTLNGLQFTTSQSSIFFTPSARIKFVPSGRVSPFFSIGGGLAHHEAGNSVTHGALQFGGGVDFKTPLPYLAIRAEVRDFWARAFSESSGAVHVSPERLHNVFAGGGVVLKF